MYTDLYFTLESASEPEGKKRYMYHITIDDIYDDLPYHYQYARKAPRE